MDGRQRKLRRIIMHIDSGLLKSMTGLINLKTQFGIMIYVNRSSDRSSGERGGATSEIL